MDNVSLNTSKGVYVEQGIFFFCLFGAVASIYTCGRFEPWLQISSRLVAVHQGCRSGLQGIVPASWASMAGLDLLMIKTGGRESSSQLGAGQLYRRKQLGPV
jgi:hypothetical protein